MAFDTSNPLAISWASRRGFRATAVNPLAYQGQVTRPGKLLGNGANGGFVTGGWGTGGVGTRALTMVDGHNIVLMNGPSTGAVAFTIRKKITSQSIEKLTWMIETPPVITAGNYTLRTRYSSDAPAADPPAADPTNYMMMNIDQGSIAFGSRQPLSIHKDGTLKTQSNPTGSAWTVSGTPDPANIKYADITLVCDANVPADQRWLIVKGLEIDSKVVPWVILGTDGDTSTYALNELQKRGIPFYNAMDGENMAANAAYIDAFLAANNELMDNGIGHYDYGQDPTRLSPDINTRRAICDQYGWPLHETFAYPYNSRSPETDAILISEGYRLARDFRGPFIGASQHWMRQRKPTAGYGAPSILNVGSFSCDQKTAATMIGWTTEAKRLGESYFCYWHGLTANDGDTPSGVQTNRAEFRTWLDDLQSNAEAVNIRLGLPHQLAAAHGY